MTNEKTYKKLLELRDFHLASLQDLNMLISEYEKLQAPARPRKRRDLKQERLDKYAVYAATGKIGKKNLLNQALEKHNIKQP